MDAEKLLKEGDLEGALAALQGCIRDDPSNVKYRIFLFQLFCVLGFWEKALTQLNVISEMDDAALAMCKSYEQVLRCESLREGVCARNNSPTIFGKPGPWVAHYVTALRLFNENKESKAVKVIQKAQQESPASGGSINGNVFEWIMDGDSRFGPMLEAFINGSYYWVPFNSISKISLDKPTDLRDLVWLPARFTWVNEGESVAFIPVRYPQTESKASVSCTLSKETIWKEMGDNVFIGTGLRTLITNENEYSLLEIEEIEFSLR